MIELAVWTCLQRHRCYAVQHGDWSDGDLPEPDHCEVATEMNIACAPHTCAYAVCERAQPGGEVRRKCRGCIHDEHFGGCTGRNGSTANPCPCFKDVDGEVDRG